MSENRGGRPSHHEGEIKKAAIAVRTAPSVRDALKAAAESAGRSVTQEVEARLTASLEADGGQRSPETWQLLNKIAVSIAEIEAMTGKRWHRDRKTAGAVLEMFDRKPRAWVNVDDPADDELVQKAWAALSVARVDRDKLIAYLEEIGIEAMRPAVRRKGLLGGGRTPGGQIIGDALAHAFKGRWRERQQMELLALPKEIATAASIIIEQLEAADEREAEAMKAYDEATAPFREVESEGRAAYRNLRRLRAEEALQRGERPDSSDWSMF